MSEHTDRCCSACLACSEGHSAREGVCLLKVASRALQWARAGSPLRPAAGASASVLVCAATRLVGTSLTCKNVCANSWQEMFLCLNEHLELSTFLQAGLLFSLPIYFVFTSRC